MIVTFISQCEKKSKRPNSDIEYETIAQSLHAPSNSKKQHITNKVTRYFFESLCTQIACTLIHVSISGLGLNKTRHVLDAFANRIGSRTWQTPITEEGLKAVKKLLKKTATKNTAVAYYKLKPNKTNGEIKC